MFLLGYDIGSSSVKVALVEMTTSNTIGLLQHPLQEMPITAPQPNWAEQNPEDWWRAACTATQKLLAETSISPTQISAIGIAYQMHGLVCLDAKGEVLRPAIIWCDSRAVDIGQRAFAALGETNCLERLLNSPGNFTASKLRWVRENEPAVFDKIDQVMLPGDYIAYRMTGEMGTTVTGLSEGILWDFKAQTVATQLLQHYEIPERMLPPVVPVFAQQGKLHAKAAAALGLTPGIPIGYRAGDQPNNALSLNVLRPGEIAATGGTSGVVYAVADQPVFDPEQRVNSFAHVNYSPERPLTGVLLCINGAGSLYRWVQQNLGALHYEAMEKLAAEVPIGADGLVILPFGNGAERMLGNKNPGANISGLQFNRHEQRHFYRAALEGIAFAFVQGIRAMRDLHIPVTALRVGNDNLFQSAVFTNTMATLLELEIEVLDTTGAVGAAKAAGVAAGIFGSAEEAMSHRPPVVAVHRPLPGGYAEYANAFEKWQGILVQTC